MATFMDLELNIKMSVFPRLISRFDTVPNRLTEKFL